ncbi:MAG: BamA/TamA family outer membrane protein, partial [Heliobacteriaceae bacterium]|nr:BamA/TamA family outer membrane protein [Heliobacteriaceae bacterium]
MRNKFHTMAIALILGLVQNLPGYAIEFWADEYATIKNPVRGEQRALGIPTATQFGEGPAASASVSANDSMTPEQEKRLIKDIEIIGTNVVDPAVVMDRLTIKSGDEYSRDMVQINLKNIYDSGYFTEKMKAVPVNNPDGTVSLKIVLEENMPVTDFTIEGNSVISTEEIIGFLMPLKGKPQNIADLNMAVANIQDAYSSKGYILARVDSVSDDPDGTINIGIKEGTIGKILIAGNEKTKDFVIERNILTEPGTVYNEHLLKEDLVRLYATQAFKDVTRDIEPGDEPDTYNITIKVEEQRTASVSVGGGVDTVTGLFGSAGIADNNFRGRGERIGLNALAGTGVMLNDASIMRRMNLQAELSYFKPYFFNSDTSLMNKIYYRDFGSYQVPLAIERRFGGEMTVAHRIKSSKHMTSTFSLGVENVSVSEGDHNKITGLYHQYNIPISERARQLEGGLFMSLSPALLYDTRDSAAVTRKGTMASLRFDEEVGILDFNKTHGKLTGMVKQYLPVFSLNLCGLIAIRIWNQCNLYNRYTSTDSGSITMLSNLIRVLLIAILVVIVTRYGFSKKAQLRLG